ncbi:uncharacterized protein A4U43_C02F5350 [Asparagus officinalis]|uniref:Uncharacterized protein n=1 Tax=Asparagus officinalis TaxID=4686 RepID=A0A5P1FHY0_ASPOF|nr:uncharacterized protein A4U43_C02F5350 [Asparagus officinalis]
MFRITRSKNVGRASPEMYLLSFLVAAIELIFDIFDEERTLVIVLGWITLAVTASYVHIFIIYTSGPMRMRIDSMLHNLEKEIHDVDIDKISHRYNLPGRWAGRSLVIKSLLKDYAKQNISEVRGQITMVDVSSC